MNKVNKLIVVVNRTCNNHCEHCSPINREGIKYKDISTQEFEKIVADFIFMEEICLFGGEPTLAPNFYSYLHKIAKAGILPGIITNGWFLEKLSDAKEFFEDLDRQGVKKIHLVLSMDTFHETQFLKRNRGIERKKYPFMLLDNLRDANKKKIGVNLEVNWVYSNVESHGMPTNFRAHISRKLDSMLSDGKISDYSITLDPLHEEYGSLIHKKVVNGKNLPWVTEIPENNNKKFNSCNPWHLAIRTDGSLIDYSYCIYAGELTCFSNHLSKSAEDDLRNFLRDHSALAEMPGSEVYANLENIIEIDGGMEEMLKTAQPCYKEDRACILCRHCLERRVL